MLKIGTDPRIRNNNGNYAFYYMEEIEQLNVISGSHSPGVLAAFESQNVEQINQMAKGNFHNLN